MNLYQLRDFDIQIVSLICERKIDDAKKILQQRGLMRKFNSYCKIAEIHVREMKGVI